MKVLIQNTRIAAIGILSIVILTWMTSAALAHHGGVSAAFGPGTPVETSSPLTLKKGSFLLYEKVELVPFKKFAFAEPENVDRFTFSNTLIGYGIKDYLTLYVLFPYSIKEQDTLGRSSGLGDPEIFLHYGFKYGAREGFKGWYSFNEDDVAGKEYTQKDWKFGLHASMTVPFGKISNKDDNGATFPMGMQPGFAVPSYGFTAIVSKMIAPHWTFNMDTAFRTFSLAPGVDGGKPGNEWRVNGAMTYEIFENEDKDNGAFLSRVDLVGEANFLNLQKDLDSERIPNGATGGSMLYLSPGLRLTFYDRASLGLLFKKAIWKDLNNEDQQQGAEGLEKYRAVATFSLSY